ncbi:M15 family metallopeptidase [Arcobacter ellisii]|uniref:D-alanyl-D-alanine carboxypeptidase, peptidase M15 family n=1 Tax=Arcobacter ellisii TaxID=913109 RepID=A0A347U9W6_9BACT|nr:M15 family metallopeptidase [Arcobacter ellisii]AXX95644.1 D-alanyl-D-alanine carboxypeptidase, peptidase M15 family [Arcobacter ellisii]RXI31481.1 hypothetical protein CP962_05050 [Arcobacter ellisii]
MLKKFTINKILFLIILSSNLLANDANKFVQAYPDFIKEVSNNHLIWNDNEKMIFDDKIENKTFQEKLNNPSLKNQLDIPYIKLSENKDYIPSKNEDAGRIRYEPFFKKMYGSNQKEVKQNLVKIIWLPKSSKKVLWVNKINDIDKKLESISNEIEQLPNNIKSFAQYPSGAFNWRKISETNRLSVHSFGIAIDLNVKDSHYWLWDKGKKDFTYKNKIPLEIVEIFEKYGFIWGGRWYHYDTMHFEYRPELLN